MVQLAVKDDGESTKSVHPSGASDGVQSQSQEQTAGPSVAEESTQADTEDDATPQNVNVATGRTNSGWVDNSRGAGVQLSWWAWLLLIYPSVLLLNDVFHFIPSGMTLTTVLSELRS